MQVKIILVFVSIPFQKPIFNEDIAVKYLWEAHLCLFSNG